MGVAVLAAVVLAPASAEAARVTIGSDLAHRRVCRRRGREGPRDRLDEALDPDRRDRQRADRAGARGGGDPLAVAVIRSVVRPVRSLGGRLRSLNDHDLQELTDLRGRRPDP
jgi:hypothetical protein